MTSTHVPRVTLAPGYSVSRVIKGGWQLAGGHGSINHAAALADMERFVDAGLTTFDCADIYLGVESLIGEYLARRRQHSGAPVQVHTKHVPDADRLARHSRADVRLAIDRSLTRLRVERIDLVQLHWWDYAVPRYVEVASWLDELRQAGKIRCLGLTNFDQPRLDEIAAAGIPVVSHQVQYSVLDRRPAGGMAPFCQDRGIGLLCYGALAGGFLSERYLRREPPAAPLENRSLVKYRLIIDECGGWTQFQHVLHALEQIAFRHGVGIGAVAIRWVLDQPGVAAVIVGARHAGHLASTLQACTLTLDEDDRAAIGNVQRRAAGPAGEVYALEREKGGPHAAIMKYTLNRAGDDGIGPAPVK
jgi:aryl-alcohol dehydrogenase-like predicted oxidoreductase